MDDDKDHDRADDTDRVPALLAGHDAIGNDGMQRIVPNPPCQFECDAMLNGVYPGLLMIPFEAQAG